MVLGFKGTKVEKEVDQRTLEKIVDKALSKNNNKVIFERLAEI